MEKDWVLIYASQQQHEIHMHRILLKEHGIESIIMNKQDSVYNAFGDIELYVNRDDILKAKKLIQS